MLCLAGHGAPPSKKCREASICSLLTLRWLPASACSIQALMSAPNPDDPLDENVARHWKTNEVDAMNTARQWTAAHAQPQ